MPVGFSNPCWDVCRENDALLRWTSADLEQTCGDFAVSTMGAFRLAADFRALIFYNLMHVWFCVPRHEPSCDDFDVFLAGLCSKRQP